MTLTKIERFAKDEMGIILHPQQLEIIRAVGEGKIVLFARRAGTDVTRKVLEAWVKEGLKDATG